MKTALLCFVLLASSIVAATAASAATTYEPTAEGLAIKAKAWNEHLVYIITVVGTSHAAKAPLKVTERSITFTDADSGQLLLLRIEDVNMPATLHVNNDLIPQGLWMDEETYALRDLEIRPLTPEEMEVMRAELGADLAEAKEAYRDAYASTACGGKMGVAAELCTMNATASADRKIRVIELKARAEAMK